MSPALSIPMADCLAFFKPQNVFLAAVAGGVEWSGFLAESGIPAKHHDPHAPTAEVFDAAVLDFFARRVSRREMAMTVGSLTDRLRRGGLIFALYGPYLGAETGTLKDSELRNSFPGFRLVEMRSYSEGLRGLFLKKLHSPE